MPFTFSNEEYADIHFIYGFCDGNAREAAREYARRFPNRRLPNPSVFTEAHMRLRQFGIRREQVRNANLQHENNILAIFDDNDRLSSRRAVLQLRNRNIVVSKTHVLRVLKRDGRKPFHFQPVQNLLPTDAAKRILFCNWILDNCRENPNFPKQILWTDEASFTRRGVFNHHNLHIWSQENPRAIRPQNFQHEFSLNIWIGLIDGYLIGPHVLPHRLNSHLFLNFLTDHLHNYLEEVPLAIRQDSWIQMDGAPAHLGRNISIWLRENFGQRWIARLPVNAEIHNGRGPVSWPPRSPDLTPLDFFIWGYLKDKVYTTPVETRDELMNRILEACNELREKRAVIRAAVNSVGLRCRKCIESEGLHFEQLF